MKAAINPPIDHNRKKLAEVLPLKSPLGVYIEPSRMCNLKCFYCMYATRGIKGGALDVTGYQLKCMDDCMFDKVVDDLFEFPELPKKITFSGLGEPLLNRNLPKLASKLRRRGYRNRLEIITNGIALNHEMSEALVEAGISRVNISIQGLSSEDYEEYCGCKIDFQKLKEEILYFYNISRNKTEVYIKIIDAQLRDGQEQKFFDIFGNMCDMIYIEHLIVLEQQMGDHGGIVDSSKNLYGEEIRRRQICPIHTYYLSINVDGDVFPCAVVGLPKDFAFGNLKISSLQNIWKSEKRKKFILGHLEGNRKNIPVCNGCTSFLCVQDDAESIDDDAKKLIGRYQNEH